MARIYTGGCQCGACRYELEGKPHIIWACHCTICQKQSGSAFGMAIVFQGARIAITEGTPSNYDRPGEGRSIRCYFCPNCGSRLYHQWFNSEGDLPFLNLKPGSLDDTSWVRAGSHIWVKSAQPWIKFSPDDVLIMENPKPGELPLFEHDDPIGRAGF